jgi:hypothetical protein
MAFHSFLTEHDTFQMRHFSGIAQFVKKKFVEIHKVDSCLKNKWLIYSSMRFLPMGSETQRPVRGPRSVRG